MCIRDRITAITMGDPAGIGPEIVVGTMLDKEIHEVCRPFVIGSIAIMDRAATVSYTHLDVYKRQVILTAGCAKYRYNKLDLGMIGDIPRVLDAGQCNDSYSLVVIAMKLKEAFGLDDINALPIIYNIAWYEQKAVLVLLALLSLGIKNIHLGPTLPAFLSPEDVYKRQ